MKLQLISDQGGSIDGYYATCISPTTHPSWLEAIERIRRLMRHLEQSVEGPPQWMTISCLITFYLSDENDWRPEKARVFVELARGGYRIKYRSSREVHYWDSFTVLEARDEVEAGRAVAEALARAERDLPGRGEPGFG